MFSFNDTATTKIYTLSLHDALPIFARRRPAQPDAFALMPAARGQKRSFCALGQGERSEEHTSELQSQFHLVCRLLLEKKKKNQSNLCQAGLAIASSSALPFSPDLTI